LEAAAYQSADVLEAMTADSGVELAQLRVDGGMTANDTLMQFQSDLLDVDVVRPVVTETTALGAAYGAGLATGLWPDLDAISAMWAEDRRWSPTIDEEERGRLRGRWAQAVERTLDWV
jgi:glycerol kinase